jgi:DeoR/GlpR family transcriptional regulator of sugar metabolism
MTSSHRREKLLELLENNMYIDVKTLVEELGVSEATARRDLGYLANMGFVVRTHGGAYFTTNKSTIHEPILDYKQHLMEAEKKAIGQAAAELVSPGDTLIIDSGSTTWYMIENLRTKKPLTVVSNDIKILMHLADYPGFTVIDTGGIIRPELKILLGESAIDMIQGLHVNWVFQGANAIDLKHGVTTTSMEEASLKQAMIDAGQKVVILADHTKFGKAVFTRVCGLEDVSLIITDAGMMPEQVLEIRALGVNLQIAGQEELID